MKVIRFHRGLLADSLKTQQEVSGLAELKAIFAKEYPYVNNIRILNQRMCDNRLPKEWNGITYYVVCDYEGFKGQCLGMCNFYEE